MAVRTIDCGACGATVPYGRLSCPSCGELLASVAGAMRPLRSIAGMASSSGGTLSPSQAVAPEVAPGPSVAADAPSDAPVDPAPPVDPDPPVDPPAPEAADLAWDPSAGPASLAEADEGWSDARDEGWSNAGDAVWSDPADEAGPAADEAATPAADPGPAHDVHPAAWTPATSSRPMPPVLHEPDELPSAQAWPPAVPAGEALEGRAGLRWPTPTEPVTPAAVPGAYLPPTPAPVPAAPSFAAAAAVDPPAIPAPARAWAGARATAETPAAPERTTTDELRALTDPARRDEMIGWVAVAGGTLAALGFLLPWSRTVIGSQGIDYFASWGLAGPGHPLVVVALLAIVALAVVGVRVPAWIRLGAPGLFLGGLLLGLVWPYLVGPLGALPGVWLSVVGAILLVASAIAALVLRRHGAPSQDV